MISISFKNIYISFHLLSVDLLGPFGASMEERSAAMTATAISGFLADHQLVFKFENNCDQVFAISANAQQSKWQQLG